MLQKENSKQNSGHSAFAPQHRTEKGLPVPDKGNVYIVTFS
jgi:hypothetical protein